MRSKCRAIKFGEQRGAMLTLLMVFIGGTFIWVCIKAAAVTVTVLFIGLFLIIFGRFFMETSGGFISKFSKALFGIADTRNRVASMEEYHDIKYTVIPEKRLYTKSNETCELTIRKIPSDEK